MKKKRGNVPQHQFKRRANRKRMKTDVNDLLRQCLEKVCELQQELNKEQDVEDDAQAAGYTACAMEALDFLAREGLPQDHPMVQTLREKLTPEDA